MRASPHHHPGGTMHRATAAAMLAATLLLTGCGSRSETAASDPTPTATKAKAAKTQPAYDEYDCRALLERNYDNDNVHDANDEAECATLSREEYLEIVKTVITGRKDDILEDAEQQITWEQAWDETDADQQQVVCDRLQTDGAEVVGVEMAESSGGDEAEQVEMSQYFLDEKC